MPRAGGLEGKNNILMTEYGRLQDMPARSAIAYCVPPNVCCVSQQCRLRLAQATTPGTSNCTTYKPQQKSSNNMLTHQPGETGCKKPPLSHTPHTSAYTIPHSSPMLHIKCRHVPSFVDHVCLCQPVAHLLPSPHLPCTSLRSKTCHALTHQCAATHSIETSVPHASLPSLSTVLGWFCWCT